MENTGLGAFNDVASALGVSVTGVTGAGPTFADVDGDGDLDLFVGAMNGDPIYLFDNTETGFVDITVNSGLDISVDNTISASFGDFDQDGRLDLFTAHWGVYADQQDDTEHLWRNEGGSVFSRASVDTQLASTIITGERQGRATDWTFAATFGDVNNDGLSDLLVVGDFRSSKVFLNEGGAQNTFGLIEDFVFIENNGMGSALADYDNDGDLDWFISSSGPSPSKEAEFDLEQNVTGNRLYRNKGDGVFEDVTDIAGVRSGYWGWGSCFADFNNDGNLDLFHVNGWTGQSFVGYSQDLSRLFMSNGDGTFSEKSVEFGIEDATQGRGISCFDLENDGDIDIFVATNNDDPRLFRNNLDAHNTVRQSHFVGVYLRGLPPNTQAIGARVYLTMRERTQMRELHVGNNYVSQNPVVAHFGLGKESSINELRILWPDGQETLLTELEVDRYHTIAHPGL